MKRQAKIEIQNALVDLMAEYPFQEISTKMICAYCNINRSTFYDYYKDKFDLLDTINSKHKEKFQFLLSALHHNFENIKQDKLKAGVFINWLSNGCNESPEEVADILLANTIKLQN